MTGANPPLGCGTHHLREGEADGREGADVEKIAPGAAITEACPMWDAKLEHGTISPRTLVEKGGAIPRRAGPSIALNVPAWQWAGAAADNPLFPGGGDVR